MIKKLITKYKTSKEFNEIKKHFKLANKHKSIDELEKVKFELLDLQGELIENNQFTESISSRILNLFYQIECIEKSLTCSITNL